MKAKKARPKLSDAEQDECYQLYKRMMAGKATSQELIRLSLLKGMITAEQYADYLEIEKNCEED